jgi:hypothetical protein
MDKTRGKVKRKLTERSDDVERLGGLPLGGFADTAHGKLADVEDGLGNCTTQGESQGPLGMAQLSRLGSKLTDHDPRSPIAIVGVRANSEQENQLGREEDSGHVEKHRVHCDRSALSGSTCMHLQSHLHSLGRTCPPQVTLPLGNCWLRRACRRAPPLPPIAVIGTSVSHTGGRAAGASICTHEHRCSRNLQSFFSACLPRVWKRYSQKMQKKMYSHLLVGIRLPVAGMVCCC